jgi:hypothetical protein
MTDDTLLPFSFPAIRGKKIAAAFANDLDRLRTDLAHPAGLRRRLFRSQTVGSHHPAARRTMT